MRGAASPLRGAGAEYVVDPREVRGVVENAAVAAAAAATAAA